MKMNNSREANLTIIIPVYNTEKYLSICIESVLKQSFAEWELILVDDGSVDASLEICAKYSQQDKRIKFIKQEHQGIGAARVAGIKASSGSYIAFMDSDDWMDELAFENLMHPFDLDETIDISICTFALYKKQGYTHMCKEQSTIYKKYNSKEALEIMFSSEEYNWSMWGKVYKKELFERNKQLYDMWPSGYGEDTYVNWRIFNSAEHVAYIPMPYYHYRYNPTSTMNQPLSNKKLIYLDIWQEILCDIEDINSKLAQNVLDLVFSIGIGVLMEFMEKGVPRNEQWYKRRDVLTKYWDVYHKKNDQHIQALCNRLMFSDEELRQKKEEYVNDLITFCDNHQKIYIYGAGRVAEELANLMTEEGLKFEGFLVSSFGSNARQFMEHNVYEMSSDIIKEKGNVGIIMGLNERNYEQVIQTCNINEHYAVFNGGKFSLRY